MVEKKYFCTCAAQPFFLCPFRKMSNNDTHLSHTICVNTADAVETSSEGRFRLQISTNGPPTNAMKLSLGSLEFPMVQYTIENDWCMIYFSEGFRIFQDVSVFTFAETTYEHQPVDRLVQVRLPLHLNPIVNYSILGTQICIECAYPHNLWPHPRRCIVPLYYWGDVELVCSPLGKVSLNELLANRCLEYKSEREFLIPTTFWEECVGVPHSKAGFLHTPTVPSPHALAELLTKCIDETSVTTSYRFAYDARANMFEFRATRFPEGKRKLRLSVFPTKLSRRIGYCSEVSATFSDSTLSEAASHSDTPSLSLPANPFHDWFAVNLAEGWYQPSHRPMCTGAPLRLTEQLELSMNRLYFPILHPIASHTCTSHFMMFSDPSGFTHNCAVPPGKYTTVSLSRHLEREMTRLANTSLPGCVFSVHFDQDQHRFVFSCEHRNQAGKVLPAKFSLLLQHSTQFDPARIGFEASALHGSDTYLSSFPVYLPMAEGREQSNVYKVTEIGHLERIRIQSSPLPTMNALIVNYDEKESILHVRTFVHHLPFAHGLDVGNLVSIGKCPPTCLLVMDEETAEWKEAEFDSAPIAARYGTNAIVVDPVERKTASEACPLDLFLKIKHTPSLSGHVDTVILLGTQVEPFNLCFSPSLPNSVKCGMLGFHEGATQWGLDGTIRTAGLHRLPPFDAPRVLSMDHPDYVLMYLLDGKRSITTHHFDRGTATAPFAKIVLYPMFREERMLPKEATCFGSEKMNLITVYFANPDGSPYHFHGVDFSFSLNVLV